MATTIQQRYRKNIIDNDFVTAKASQYLAPVGRFFYSLIFILSGLNHFNSETINYAASSGLPFANFLEHQFLDINSLEFLAQTQKV